MKKDHAQATEELEWTKAKTTEQTNISEKYQAELKTSNAEVARLEKKADALTKPKSEKWHKIVFNHKDSTGEYAHMHTPLKAIAELYKKRVGKPNSKVLRVVM